MANSRKIAKAIFLIEWHPPQAALWRRCPAGGLGVDVGKCSKEQGRAGVAQFFRTNLSREVLVWCFTDLKRKKHLALFYCWLSIVLRLCFP